MKIESHVKWKKLVGKPNASMMEREGFGHIIDLVVGGMMCISGSHGVTTTEVKSVTNNVLGIVVVTKNSVYLVEVDKG